MSRKSLTWPQALAAFETHLRARRASPRTRAGDLREVRLLAEHTDPLRPDQVRLADLRDYQVGLLTGPATRTGRPAAAGTVARITSSLRAFFAFLAADGLLKADPARRLERPKLPRRAVGDVLTEKEVGRLLAAPDRTTPLGLRDRAVLELLYSTALRRAEACALDLADLDHTGRELHVRAGKGEKDRLVPVARTAYLAVAEYLDRGRPSLASEHADSAAALFLTSWGRRANASSLFRAVKQARAAAGLEKNVTPHTLRRTCASHLLKTGASLRHIQLLLGHSSLDTTARYLRLDTRELRRELLLRHPRERFEV